MASQVYPLPVDHPTGRPEVDAPATFTFTTDNRLDALGPCNRYTAEYQVDGQLLTVQHGWATAMLCLAPEGIMEADQVIFSVLEPDAASVTFSGLSGEVMELRAGDVALTLRRTPGEEPAGELVIEGTGPTYTLEEAQVFGEFGPLLWGLVTALSGSDDIPHGPNHEWVIWGPLWAGRLPVQGPYDVYGVTDLSAVDPESIAAVVPTGRTIVLWEVRWSLDELNQFRQRLRGGFPGNGICSIGSSAVNKLRVTATTPHPDLGDVPPEAVLIEVVDKCEGYFLAGDESVP